MNTFIKFILKVLISTVITIIASITKQKIWHRIGAY